MRVAKGVSAAMSITGTVLVFTPLLPLGVGLLASSAGIGVTASAGDAIGQHAQKEDLRKARTRGAHNARTMPRSSPPSVPTPR